MDRKYQVFISSTYKDLIPEREKVRDAILRIYHFPVGMELFGAANEEQWEIIKETIDTSDFYVLLIGTRYGTVIEGEGISYTEKEYLYAVEKNVPILAFIIDDSVHVDPKNVETKHIKKFNAFRQKVMDGRLVDCWSNPDDLAAKVTAALLKQIARTKRPGWIRGDSFDIEKSMKVLVELTEKNKALEEEIRQLKGNQRSPRLTINFFNCGTRGKQNDKGTELKELRLKMIEKDGYTEVTERLSLDDIRKYPGISSADITKYNSALPTKDDLRRYDESVFAFRNMVENGYHISAEIENEGSLKALDVEAVITFPEEFIVLDWEKVQAENPPLKPKIPMKPSAIMSALAGSYTPFMNTHWPGGYKATDYYGEGKYPVKSPTALPLMSSLQPRRGTQIDGNTVTIWSDDLLHKSGVMVGDFCVIPKRKGTFKIEVSLMCEEYIEPEKQEIEITVV